MRQNILDDPVFSSCKIKKRCYAGPGPLNATMYPNHGGPSCENHVQYVRYGTVYAVLPSTINLWDTRTDTETYNAPMPFDFLQNRQDASSCCHFHPTSTSILTARYASVSVSFACLLARLPSLGPGRQGPSVTPAVPFQPRFFFFLS